ncbi:MAG: hypothetical protein KAS72_03200 [Phycisphaerales bacterium]|nr:hypothetical protein [Phycisphaerales bacterium]
MWFIRGVLLSGLGGLIGAVIWAAVATSLNAEVKLVAVVVAALCGLGMRIGTAGQGGFMMGILAGVIAVFAVLIGRQTAVEYVTHEAPSIDTRNVWAIADEVVYEWELEGGIIDWPEGVLPEDAWAEQDYPYDVWDEAEYRYQCLTDTEQADLEAYPVFALPQWQVSYLADEVLWEWLADGEEIYRDELIESDNPMHKEEFPTDVWAEAERRWSHMDAAEKDELERQICAEWEVQSANLRAMLDEARAEMYRSRVGGRNIYLVVLAFLVAAAIGGDWGD